MRSFDCQFTAAITAGGQSRRFGSDKALYRLEGQTLLERVARSLEFAPHRLLIAPQGKYTLNGWQNLPDLHPGKGPLSGLETALTHAPSEWVALAAVDLPWLERAFWELLLAGRGAAGVQAVVPLDGRGRLQPLAALYHRSSLPTVRRRLEQQTYRMTDVLADLEWVSLDWAVLEGQGLNPRLFDNLNSRADLPPGDPGE